MDRRLELQSILEGITNNVYFHPPESFKISYPCIVYNMEGKHIDHANNGLYKSLNRYNVVYIDRDPDSPIPDEILKLPMCRFDRFYLGDGLIHWSFEVYY